MELSPSDFAAEAELKSTFAGHMLASFVFLNDTIALLASRIVKLIFQLFQLLFPASAT